MQDRQTALPSLASSTRTYTQRKQKKRQFFPLFFAALGYLGCIGTLFSLYTPPLSRKIFFPFVVLSFLITSGISFYFRHSGKILGLLLLTVPAVLLSHWKQTTEGILLIFNHVYSNAHHTDIAYFPITPSETAGLSVTMVCCCIAALLACFFAHYSIKQPWFLLTAAVPFLLMEPGLYLGIPLTPILFAPLLAYWCGMLAYCRTLRHARDTEDHIGKMIAGKMGSITAWFTLLLYAVIVIFGTFTGYARSDADRQKMHRISQSLSAFDIRYLPESFRQLTTAIGLPSKDYESRLGRESALHYRDKDALTLTFDKLPENAMYLKGFTGSSYENNSWKPNILGDSEQGEQISVLMEKFNCVPQTYPYLFQRSILPESDTFTCTIHYEQMDVRYYQPYASFSKKITYPDDGRCLPCQRDDYCWTVSAPQNWVLQELDNTMHQTELSVNSLNGNETTKQFLETLGFNSDTISVRSRFPLTATANSPEDIKGKVIPAVLMENSVYQDYVSETYTALPENEKLSVVFDAMPDELKSQQPKTASEQYQTLCDIRNWMADCAEYDLAPGKTPSSRDFVQFFLLENHKGYCMHFATAGTILARYLGIPARYCEGYIADNDILGSAERNEDHTLSITLTDRQSHAWTEFYVEGYGWMPFEMTPGYYAENSISHTTQPESIQTEVASEATTSQTEAEASVTFTTATHLQTNAVTSTTLIKQQEKAQTKAPTAFWILPGVIAFLVLLLAVYFFVRRCYLRQRTAMIYDKTNPKKAVLCSYHWFLRLMRWYGLPYRGGVLTDYQKDIQQKLMHQNLPYDAVEVLISHALAAELSGTLPDAEAVDEAANAITAFAKSIYDSSNLRKKFCMKYIWQLIP